jgi:chromosome segregation ATPase
MKKAIALAVIILWALASMAGYLYLTGKITSGKRLITAGQNKVDKGQTALDEGKVKLEAGKQELSEGKKEYEDARDSWLLVFADNLFKGGKGFKEAEKKIAAGDKQVAQGEDKVNAGERRLDAGERKLSEGREQLGLAEGARIACALGAAVFTSLAVVLGFWWRRSLRRTFRSTGD